MGWIETITVDADHPASLARFQAAALEGYSVRGYDEAEIARLAADGLTPETDPTVMIDGPGATLCLQKMPGKATGRNRWHVDLRGSSRQSEVEKLCRLGATVRRCERSETVGPRCSIRKETPSACSVKAPSDEPLHRAVDSSVELT